MPCHIPPLSSTDFVSSNDNLTCKIVMGSGGADTDYAVVRVINFDEIIASDNPQININFLVEWTQTIAIQSAEIWTYSVVNRKYTELNKVAISVQGTAACAPNALTSRTETWSSDLIQEYVTYQTTFTVTTPVNNTLPAPGIWIVASSSLDLTQIDKIKVTDTADTSLSYGEPFWTYPDQGWVLVTLV